MARRHMLSTLLGLALTMPRQIENDIKALTFIPPDVDKAAKPRSKHERLQMQPRLHNMKQKTRR